MRAVKERAWAEVGSELHLVSQTERVAGLHLLNPIGKFLGGLIVFCNSRSSHTGAEQ